MRRRLIVLVALLVAGCAKAPPPDPGKAESYAVQIAVTPAPGGPLQRLAIPASALAAAKVGGMTDMRVFDARGRVVPATRFASRTCCNEARVGIIAHEIRQDGEGQRQTTVVVNPKGEIVARVDDGGRSAEGEAALFDTREVRDPVLEIAVIADLPLRRIVNFELEASSDLKTWSPLGEAALFRADDYRSFGYGTVVLSGASLRGRYVRVSWTGTGVAVREATLLTLPQGVRPRLAIPGKDAKLMTAHDIRFRVPVADRPQGLVLKQTADDSIVPVRLFGREHSEAPWEHLSASTLRSSEPNGVTLAFNGSRMREYRLEADHRTAGFSAPPTMTLLFDAPELLVRFSGHPPYTLAAGLPGAPSAWLSPDEIAPDWQRQYDRLPYANAPAPTPIVSLAPAGADSPLSPKRLVLWLALLAGTAVLALAVWRLMRGGAGAATEG